MTTHERERQDAARRIQADIASLADWIELELESPDVIELTSLADIRKKMIDALAELSGTGPDEIQRNLDELYM